MMLLGVRKEIKVLEICGNSQTVCRCAFEFSGLPSRRTDVWELCQTS